MPAWSFNRKIRTPLLLIGGIEALVAFSSLYVAGIIVFGSIELCEDYLGGLFGRSALVTAVTMTSLVAVGLYQFHQRINFGDAVSRLLVGLLAASLGLALLFYLIPPISVSRDVALVAFLYTVTLYAFFRYIFVHTVDENVFRHKTLVYGAGRRSQSISDLRRRADRRGFKIVGRIAAPGDAVEDHSKLIEVSDKTIAEIAEERKADEIVVAMDDRRRNLPIGELLDARLKGIDVIDLIEFLERESGKIRADLVNPGWLIFSQGFQTSPAKRFVKRAMDLVVSVALLAVAWPVMLVVALLIRFEDGWQAPVLYRQTRVGRSLKPFQLLKFRSMREDAEKDGKAVWAAEKDPRVTRLGGVLRKYRLDELPQLLNVIRGDMSIVGPRPERPEFVEELSKRIPYYAERHTMKPGVTGWAQLKYGYGASERDSLEKLHFDLYYVKNHSLLLDVMIVLQTVEVVIWKKGGR